MTSVGCEGGAGDQLHRETPMVITYSVNSADTGALRLVNTYYAKELRYMVFDEKRKMTHRVLNDGEVSIWYEGDHLYMRETNGDYCTCAELSGPLLEEWMTVGASGNFTYSEERVDYNGWKAYEGYALNDNQDTVKVLINDELPNAWFDQAGFPGLPMEFAYNLRDTPVLYAVESIKAYEKPYDPSGFASNCVRIPGPLFAGVDPESDLDIAGNRIWVYGYIFDEDMDVKTGTLTVENTATGEQGSMKVEYGSFDVELLPGQRYILDFTAPGKTHKRIEIDALQAPEEGPGFNFDMNVMLFDNDQPELNQYLKESTVSTARYLPEIDNFAFDTLYEAAVAREIERLRNTLP